MIAVVWLALAAAQDTVRPPRLELGNVYQAARAQSPRSEAARAVARAATARVPAAKLPPDPSVQLGFENYSLPSLAPMDVTGMTTFRVMQEVPTAGKLRYAGRSASFEAAASAKRAQSVEWDVRTDAAMAFYDLYSTDQALVVARETLRLLQDIYAIAAAMYRVGEGRQTDVLRAQVEIARMIEDTVRMTTMRAGMAGRLNAVLNQPAETPVASPALPAFPDTVTSLESLVAQAQRGRPMVRAAESDVDAAAARATLARRELWPNLAVGFQYGQRGANPGTERAGSLMLGASVPVFAQSRQLKMREEALAMRQMAEAELTDMRARTRGDVVNSYAALVRARNLRDLYRTTIIPQAEATVGAALAAYRVGSVDFLTLLDDRLTVNRYKQELFALEADQGKSWAELEMQLGRELFDPPTSARPGSGARDNRND